MYGYYAGYNTTLICGISHKCWLNCYGNGCLGMRFVCDNSSQGNTSNSSYCFVSCNETQSISCPVIYGSVNDVDYDDLSPIDFILDIARVSEINEINCELQNATTVDYCELYQNIGISLESVGNLCLRGGAAVRDVSSLVTTGNGSGIVCSGTLSCYSTSLISAMNMNSIVECGGSAACAHSGINTNSTVVCTAYGSCITTTIKYAQYLFKQSQS